MRKFLSGRRTCFPYLKVFWALVTFCGVGMAIYMTTLFWDRYSSNPTRTTITTLHAPTPALPFPAVTLCNEDIVIESKVRTFVKTLVYSNISEEDLIDSFFQLQAFTKKNQIYWNLTDLQMLHSVLNENNYTIEDVMEIIGQNCKDLLVTCQWNFMKVSCVKVFKNTFSKLGMCCTFYGQSSSKNLRTYTDNYGTEGTLSLVINPMIEPSKNQKSFGMQVNHIKVLFHDALNYPDFRALSKIITTGTQTEIQIFGTKVLCSAGMSHLSLEQRGCVFPGEIHLKHTPTYSDANCFIERKADEIMQLCNCVPYYYDFSELPKCNVLQLPCLIEASVKNGSWKEYGDECPASCEDTLYEVKTTHIKLEKGNFYYFRSSDHIENIGEHTTRLKIYFVKFQKILHRDILLSARPVNLIASFGGIYSLFMGCSVITICEIIYYCTLRLFVKKHISRRRIDPRK